MQSKDKQSHQLQLWTHIIQFHEQTYEPKNNAVYFSVTFLTKWTIGSKVSSHKNDRPLNVVSNDGFLPQILIFIKQLSYIGLLKLMVLITNNCQY